MLRSVLLCMIAYPVSAAEAVTHTVLAADYGTGKLAIVNPKGEVEWEYSTKHDIHDLHMLRKRQHPHTHQPHTGRRDQPEEGNCLELRIEAQGGLSRSGRSPFLPAATRRQHHDRGVRQLANH